MSRNFLYLITSAILLLPVTSQVYGFNYHEIEVYGHQTEGEGITELEMYNSISNGEEETFGNKIFRTTLEANFGVLEHLDFAVYFDFVDYEVADKDSRESKYAGTRFRLHGGLYEKGELPIDLGYYIEVGLPKNSETIYEIEFKPIIEKDIGQFTLKLNPIFEFEKEEEKEYLPDGSIKEETETEFETAYAVSLSYRFHPLLLPSIEAHGDFADEDERIMLLVAKCDYNLGNGWGVGAGLGFGMTDNTEKRLLTTMLEYEF